MARAGPSSIEPEGIRGTQQAPRSRARRAAATLADLKGDLHLHTVASDGQHTLDERVEACRAATPIPLAEVIGKPKPLRPEFLALAIQTFAENELE